jgi:translocation and assembly module TamB
MTDLNGTLSASLDGTAPEALALDARLALDSSRVNRQAVEGGRLDLSMREGVVRADLALAAARQRIGLSATAFPLAAAPRVRVETDTLQNVNLGAWAGVEGLDTALNGSLAVDARGASADALVVDGRLDLGAGRVNRAPVDGGTVRFETAQGTGRLGGRLRLAGGGVQVDARADLTADTTAYRLQAALGTLDAGALAGLDSSFAVRVDTARWSLDGRGLDPATLTASTTLETGRVLVDRLLIDAVDLRGRVARGVLRLDTLTVASSALGVRGGGTLGFAGPSTTASDLDLVAQIQDARPLRRLLGAERLRLSSGRAEAHVYGTPGRLRFDGRLEVRSLTYNDVRLAGLDVSASGRQGADAAVEQLELDGRLSFLSLPALTVEDTRVRAAYDSSRLDLTSTVRLDRQRTARLEARVDPRPGRERVTVRRADLRLGRDRWSLLQEATVTYTDAVRVRGLLLASSNQQIAADGVLDLDGRQSFVVTVERFRMGAVAEVFGLEGLDGRLSGSAALTGPAAAPRIDGRLDIDVRSRGSDVGTLQLDLAYDSLAATVDARLAHAAGGTLSVTGSLPVDLRLAAPTPADVASRPAQLSVAADSFSLGWIDPFVDPALATNLGGTLAANIEVGGTLDRPVVSGTASLRGGRASLPATGVTYQRATADAALEGEQIRLTNLAVRSPNGGTLRGDGAINLTELTLGEFDLGLTASNFLAIDTRAYRGGTVRGDLTLRGTTRRPVLNGTVGVTSADVYLAEATAASAGSELATVALSEEDQLTLEERFGVRVTAADTTTFDAYEALAMDLGVRLGRDVWIRQQGTPELNIPLTGTLDLSKASMEDPQVFGSIEVVADRGTIRQFGQTFEIDRGTITFNGDPFAPYLDVTAAYEQRSRETQQREVRIELSLEGRPDDLSPRLTSQPPMDTRNILSYLATGQAAGQLLGGGGTGGAGESLSQIPLGIATNFVENLAASNLGLDVVRLQVDPQGGYSLTFGRYVTPRLFVSSQLSSLSRSADATDAREERFGVTLEYQLTDYLLLRTLRRPSDALQINGLLEYSY